MNELRLNRWLKLAQIVALLALAVALLAGGVGLLFAVQPAAEQPHGIAVTLADRANQLPIVRVAGGEDCVVEPQDTGLKSMGNGLEVLRYEAPERPHKADREQ